MSRVEGRSYGQRVPPLTSVIKSILDRYPDGGQILKEIIQNADDASATSVSFLLDSRHSHYGTSSLLNPHLGKFQGPALYSINNARFQEEDWDGLESLMDSNKKEEPLKVGRFGIGFNSIYHVTDLPSVASGNRLAFLDPHEVYFGKKETGQQFDLKGPLLDDYTDQFSPFEDILGYKISESFVDGTIFRFPLRNESSKLAHKLYTSEKVHCLFDSLREEASLILLFLKNIEEICLYETNNTHKERLLFRVRLHDCCRRKVREERQTFLKQAAEWKSRSLPVLKLNLEMTFEIFEESTETRQEKWLTHNMIGDDKSKMREKALIMHLLPWVGFASPLSAEGVKSMKRNGGRIFCFLPLPPDSDSKTGYPVHVHGYFGLTDNRRGLKWPGPECQNNDMAEWNVNLMKHVGAKAYSNLLGAMTCRLKTGHSKMSKEMIDVFYQSWPNSRIVHDHWDNIIKIVFKLMLSKNVFWTWSYGGKWLNLNQAVFERLKHEKCSKQSRQVVMDVLHQANEPVVSLPSHVDTNMPQDVRTITPQYIRAVLRKNYQGLWGITETNRLDKIAMLEYILSDENFADMSGIALLPLGNGCFSSFKAGRQCSPNEIVYVESCNNKMALVEGMEGRFLDPLLKLDILSRLSKKAVACSHLHESPLQLVLLEPMNVIELLRDVLPENMLQTTDPVAWNPSQGNHPSEKWLELFWNWLHETFSDLSCVEGLPIIKCSLFSNKALAKLSRNTKIIRKYGHNSSQIPDKVTGLLKKSGIIVLDEVPQYISQHHCFSMYIAEATPEGILQVLHNAGTQRVINELKASNPDTRRALRDFLSTLRTNLSNKRKMVLKSLPIFEAIDGTSFIEAHSFTAPLGFYNRILLKIQNASKILSAEDLSSKYLLLNILRVPQLTQGQFICREVLPYLSCYTIQQVTSLMCMMLRRMDALLSEEPQLYSLLSNTEFIDCGKGRMLRPKDLFDPRTQLNNRLLEGEDFRFPIKEYAKEDILVQLTKLGLKGTFDEHDVSNLIQNIHSFVPNIRYRKAIALLELLENTPDLLSKQVNISGESVILQNYLKNMIWVPCRKDSLPNYPSCMPCMSVETDLFRPNQIVSPQYGIMVGAVMPVLQAQPSPVMQRVFGWDKPPDASQILRQLSIASEVLESHSLQRKEKNKFGKMVKLIYEALSDDQPLTFLLQQVNFPCVWNGQGFTSPKVIAFERQANFELEPYLYTIPEEMQEPNLRRLFSMLGVQESFTEENLLDVLSEIKVKHDKESMKSDVVAKDKSLALNILQWTARNGPLRYELREKVYVPVMKSPNALKLVSVTESMFCDADWLRGNYIELERVPELTELSLIDENISNTTAYNLGVLPMSQCVAKPEMLGFEQAGPYEPITRRLKNILDEYKEGIAVLKELIQNADDAGATEVKFLLDWRQHPTKKLFSEGMKETQGPALLAYNNAVFTKEDFQNINKLAGATKKEDLEKIGRFGLGFNSVYHITDTPSFVSSSCAVYFDPDTRHLGNIIQSPQHPGIKIDLEKNKNTLLCYPDQFQPYQGIFDCDVRGVDLPFEFDGTLFRFPFRKSVSEICDKLFTKEDVKNLLQSFEKNAPTILLNTQNVRQIAVLELEQLANQPKDMKLIMKVERNVLYDSGALTNTSFLQDCACWTKTDDDDNNKPPQRSKIISILQSTRNESEVPKTYYWLQCDLMGDGESLELATSREGKEKGLLSCAGVAVNLKPVEQSKNKWRIQKIDGEAFCFLPLSILTGLPVHVNGYFAITSNRRGIWEQTTDESPHFQPIEARWNTALMKDGIAKAYLEILKEAKRMEQGRSLEEYDFCSLWPDPDYIQSQVWKSLVVSVYSLIASSSSSLFKSGDNWCSINECCFPDEDLLKVSASLEILQQLGYKIANLTPFARKGFSWCTCKEQIQNQTISQEKFLKEVFFPNIGSIPNKLRNQVVCFVIDGCLMSGNESKKAMFKNLLSSNACIPCSSSQDLQVPNHLVHPYGDVAYLYSVDENKMPVGECFCNPERLLVLEELGMTKDKLDWDQVFNRAQSVENLSYESGLNRMSSLIGYLNKHISEMPKPDLETKQKLGSLHIFPAMKRPHPWFYSWAGEKESGVRMFSSHEQFDMSFIDLVGSVKPILDEGTNMGCGNLSPKVRQLFQFSNKQPYVGEVLKQLLIVCEHFGATAKSPCLLQITNRICMKIYSFLNGKLDNEEEMNHIKFTLQDLPWLFVEDCFVSSAQLAFEWDCYGAQYLYGVPRSLAKYSELLFQMDVKRAFDMHDIVMALRKMKADKEGDPLNNREFKASKEFLDEISRMLNSSQESAIPEYSTPMPDQNRILQVAKELVINDAPWVTVTDDTKYIHKDIPIDLAYKLGASSVRSKSLEDISRTLGEPFGQREPLTDRLSSILKAYPCDFGILKELLQNADDAQANEIHFVYDPRMHEGDRIFTKSWKELQGPALCIYNDRPFSEKDLEGIQRIGIGSKYDSPEKTGQYGIGFNSVYHLTDCPSFVTNGDTLCILDPHARYAPGATKQNPGRLIGPFQATHTNYYKDVFPGYLGDMFELKGSTMFRLPLRNKETASKSDICKKEILSSIESLLWTFKDEAKESLLFLNHVKKISISKINDGKLTLWYKVSASIEDKDECKRCELGAYIKGSKHRSTNDIERFEIFYPMTLKDNYSEEKWIVQQTIGISSTTSEVPNGKENGLLPRAGVAAKVSHLKQTDQKQVSKAFCFLPLPVKTGLPLHVNGHFALDSGRRHLWQDEDENSFKTRWNHFMRTEMVADAYINLLLEARRYIPYLKLTDQPYFSHMHQAIIGLEWYEDLIPSQRNCQSTWKDLAVAVLRKVICADKDVLPLLQTINKENQTRHLCHWLFPTDSFFPTSDCGRDCSILLRNLGMKLVSFKRIIYEKFKEADTNVKEISPDVVLEFLSSNSSLLKQLPCKVQDSRFGSIANTLELLTYCMKDSAFPRKLDGAPLLISKDGNLRVFTKEHPVFLSTLLNLVKSTEKNDRFAINEIVLALKPVCKDLFKQNPPTVLQLKLDDLATFFPFIFKENCTWSVTATAVSWSPEAKDRDIRRWLENLWAFIAKRHREIKSKCFLKPLKEWPVIPLRSGYLLPVALSKTALDLTESESWSHRQKLIVKALRDLGCPEVDMNLIESKGDKVLLKEVLKTYLAYPNSVSDLITVLDSLMAQGDKSQRVDGSTALLILQFLQEDSSTLQSNTEYLSILRRLPFYETIDGRLIKLAGSSLACKVQAGIPLIDSEIWMEGTKDIFLKPYAALDRLHQLLGVQLKSHISCYIDFVFPKFEFLKTSTRLEHLIYIKENLFHGQQVEDVERLHKALQKLKFIPDLHSGELHTVSYYYDPENPVFKAMLSKDKFPASPFNTKEWISFLCRIGLQTTFTKDQFLSFAKEVESQAQKKLTKALINRSQVLINYLFQEESLHEAHFLHAISRVKFVVPYKVDSKYSSLIHQHLFDNTAGMPLIPFKDSHPKKHKALVWGCAILLPDCVWPSDPTVRQHLGIIDKPTLDLVKKQVQLLCTKFESKDCDLKEPISKCLLEVMSDIYTFLQDGMNPSEINGLFHNVPLVLVEEGRVFVRCKQIAFEMTFYEEQPPYLYKVPREFGPFERLFKSIGATEKPCPSQYASILEMLWEGSNGQVLHAEEIRHVKKAVHALFRALQRLHKANDQEKMTCETSLESVQSLYLPDEKDQLKPSTSLYYANSALLRRIDKEKFMFDFLHDLKGYIGSSDHEEVVLGYLPSRLQVKMMSKVLVEDVEAKCLDHKCTKDEEGSCSSAARLRLLISSGDLKNGIISILKHQNPSNDIDQVLSSQIDNLAAVIDIVCLEKLETVLKNNKGEEQRGTRMAKSYFTKSNENYCRIFIQHGAEHYMSRVSHELCEAVNTHIGLAVNQDQIAHLESMIMHGLLDSPSVIPSVLEDRNIKNYTGVDMVNERQGIELGTAIPLELEYLLVQKFDFLFRPGEFVCYEKPEELEQGKYIYARIVRETAAPKVGGRTKKAKRDPTTGKRKTQNPLLRKYLIDTGNGTYTEVDALDLYKLKRPEEMTESNQENTTVPKSQDVVPYTGDGQEPGPSTSGIDQPGIPHTWEKAVKEVDKALENIMKLPKEQRNKALKRLYLRWHPDKNPGMEELATKVMQYVQNEFKRLTEGCKGHGSRDNSRAHDDFSWEDIFKKWDQRARRQRASYDNYQRSNPGFTRNFRSDRWNTFTRDFPFGGSDRYHPNAYPFGTENSSYRSPDPKMARIWLNQCREDLESIKHLFSTKTQHGFYWLICFQCSQVVEKSLKGALYGISGISESQLESHDLTSLAYALSRLPRAPDVLHSAGKLLEYYEHTRYPHKHNPAKTPKEVYTFQQAKEAYEIAKTVLKDMKDFVGILHL